jgi:hypothetical protein
MPPVGLPDHAFAAQLAQIVRQPRRRALRGLRAESVREPRPELRLGERPKGEPGTSESCQEPHRPRRAEPETGDALPSMLGGSDQPLEGRAVQGGSHSLRLLEARHRVIRDEAQ